MAAQPPASALAGAKRERQKLPGSLYSNPIQRTGTIGTAAGEPEGLPPIFAPKRNVKRGRRRAFAVARRAEAGLRQLPTDTVDRRRAPRDGQARSRDDRGNLCRIPRERLRNLRDLPSHVLH